MRRLTLAQARRLALHAQGFNDPRPSGRVDRRHFRRVLDRMGVVQLDSVNVCVRSHYLPFFARLGAYDQTALDDWLWRSRENHEYLAHEAAITPIDTYPLWGWRRASGRWQLGVRLEAEQPGYLAAVLDEVARDGPLSVKELADPGERTGPWWGYGKGKLALEWLYVTGRLAIDHRNRNFVTYYDLPARIVPAEILGRGDVAHDDAHRALLVRAAKALGVGTAADLADYHRLKMPVCRPLIADLVARGELEEVEVAGWRDRAYTLPDVTLSRRATARSLLTPFDPVVWFRDRAERLFDFHYRIEIYVPEPKRVYGYYVLPFLLGDRLVARVDCKADRKAGVLRVPGAFLEGHADAVATARELADALHELATWQGLTAVEIGHRGDLAPALRALGG